MKGAELVRKNTVFECFTTGQFVDVVVAALPFMAQFKEQCAVTLSEKAAGQKLFNYIFNLHDFVQYDIDRILKYIALNVVTGELVPGGAGEKD